MSFTKRRSGSIRGRLPHFSSVIQEKYHGRHPPWFVPYAMGIPGRARPLKVWILNPTRVHQSSISTFGPKKGLLVLFLFVAGILVVTTFAVTRWFGPKEQSWPVFTSDPPTLVFHREDIARIWSWEIKSGHYPSRRRIPQQVGLNETFDNPALPPRRATFPTRIHVPAGLGVTITRGVGARRVYLDVQSRPPHVAYPPRPVPGSIADLDIVMEHCDFSENKYVRDCLEVLRVGAGLDNGRRLRRGKMQDFQYIFVEQTDPEDAPAILDDQKPLIAPLITESASETLSDVGLVKKKGIAWEVPPIALAQERPYKTHSTSGEPCDPENPRYFHLFWTGPFTDKPYLALLSFLFTQNTGLNAQDSQESVVCRPKFLLWINPGPAAAMPNPSARREMFDGLKANPWAAPFLHPRFKDVIEFRLWNTTEQLDGVKEIAGDWRRHDLFNSGGHIISVPAKHSAETSAASASDPTEPVTTTKTEGNDMLNRIGSKSSNSYDRLSVILSDMARFILCHRYGGIYLDADTLLLRDWEELWGWRGAYAYRWSRLEKYNTAVLHLNKGSALGTFLFRTALKNNLDFHPMTVSRYLKEAHLEGLLLRLPDALFDSAWLSTEYYQWKRPPQPFFTDFGDFFDTPPESSAAPHALGFDGFFKGAFSYHFHNYWWKPFDPARNWPDLGPRFKAGEDAARLKAMAAVTSTPQQSTTTMSSPAEVEDEADQRDLDWSTVMKRTFEAYVRGERPSMYGEWIQW